LTIKPLPWETPKDFALPDSLVKEQGIALTTPKILSRFQLSVTGY
jgi:hypothetical protein